MAGRLQVDDRPRPAIAGALAHFAHLSAEDRDRLFLMEPVPFGRQAGPRTMALALGATLYMPGTRPHLAQDLRGLAAQGVTSAVICLEDAIDDHDVIAAQQNVVRQLRQVRDGAAPLTFIRVRHPEQITAIVAGIDGDATPLTGFVLPKFTERDGAAFLDAVTAASVSAGLRLLSMPVLESASVIHRESRTETLRAVHRLLGEYPGSVLAVRIGATDLSGLYGLRRTRDLTIYDIRVVADVIGDIVNVFARADGTGYLVSGPVWEYFGGTGRLFKPQLRESPFQPRRATRLRHDLIASGLDGLLREAVLDKANGLTGKTVIHPSHVPLVHATMVVTAEEYADARDILLADTHGGAQASAYRNKMNESKPHRAWAERTLCRAEIYGVAADGVSAVDLLVAGSAR